VGVALYWRIAFEITWGISCSEALVGAMRGWKYIKGRCIGVLLCPVFAPFPSRSTTLVAPNSTAFVLSVRRAL
jgi:hypothetical protein